MLSGFGENLFARKCKQEMSFSQEIFSSIPGGIYGVVRPDPFPNSAVKRARADDSRTHVQAKVGSCPLIKKTPETGLFYIPAYKLYKTSSSLLQKCELVSSVAFFILRFCLISGA